MTFQIKPPTPITDSTETSELRKRCKQLERELIAAGHEQLTCANCGAVRNDSNDLTKNDWHVPPQTGQFVCPLCGHENHWRRVSRFITS